MPLEIPQATSAAPATATPPSYRRLVELQAAKHLGATSVSREARAALGNAALELFDRLSVAS